MASLRQRPFVDAASPRGRPDGFSPQFVFGSFHRRLCLSPSWPPRPRCSLTSPLLRRVGTRPIRDLRGSPEHERPLLTSSPLSIPSRPRRRFRAHHHGDFLRAERKGKPVLQTERLQRRRGFLLAGVGPHPLPSLNAHSDRTTNLRPTAASSRTPKNPPSSRIAPSPASVSAAGPASSTMPAPPLTSTAPRMPPA